MDINNVLRKILNERNTQSTTARGINYKDTASVLEGAINSCNGLSFLKGKRVKQMTPSYPVDGNTPLMYKFEDLFNMRPEAVAYAGGQMGNEFVVVFGVVDPKATERALLAYSVKEGGKAQRLADGAGMKCPFLQNFESYGQANLSEYNQAILQSFLQKYGSMYTVSDKTNALNFKRVPMRDLRLNGQPLPWEGDPDGYVWQKVEGGSTTFSDNPEEVDKKMKAQGFTDNQNEVVGNEALMELGFYLKDVMKDLASFQIDPSMVTNKPYWPTEAGGVVVDPTQDQCKEFVRLLTACRNNDKSVTSTQCLNKLFQRKLSTIRCNKKGMFKAGGVFGLKDEFESLMSDTGKYGLANLAAGLGKVRMGRITAESTLDKKINKILNEQHRKFSFTSKPQPKFNQELVESLAFKAVMVAHSELQRGLKRFNTLNEDMSAITGALGSNLLGGLKQSGKEFIAKKIIDYLGFDSESFIGLFFINLFANLDLMEIPNIVNNCEKFTPQIVKSALEAWLDLAMKKIGKGSMEGLIYSALKNTVTETASKTTIYAKLENLAVKMVCPIIEGLADGLKSGDLSIM